MFDLIGNLFFYLLAAHFVCDYPLQGDFLAKAKDRNTDIGKVFWVHALTAHSFIQGLGVAICTGLWWMGMLEVIAHWLIDYGKCDKRYSIHTDQFLHVMCKVLWTALTIMYLNR